MKERIYRVNEIFGPTLQGEGVRTGTVNLWLRFAHCNLDCTMRGPVWKGKDETPAGFQCDTDFAASIDMRGEEIIDLLNELDTRRCRSVVVSGGEPSLQLDIALIRLLTEADYYIAVETNGTRRLPEGVDWITVSPKTRFDLLKQRECDEFKVVLDRGMPLPEVPDDIYVDNYVVSPAYGVDPEVVPRDALDWCIEKCLEDPRWRLSLQDHKWWNVR